MREFLQGQKALPLVPTISPLYGIEAERERASGDAPCTPVADVPLRVRIDKVLRGPLVCSQRLLEFLPVTRSVDAEKPEKIV